jgi:hypothetical protein
VLKEVRDTFVQRAAAAVAMNDLELPLAINFDQSGAYMKCVHVVTAGNFLFIY